MTGWLMVAALFGGMTWMFVSFVLWAVELAAKKEREIA